MPIATLSAVLAVAVATVVVGTWGLRLSRTTSDFLVASRSVGPGWNAAAISGEYLSAASFLGVAGLIAKHGADAMWYPVGFTVGYLGLLLLVAAPLRRSGAYTVPDFAEFRLRSRRARRLAMVTVVVVCILYTVPQFQGAGLALHVALGLPSWVGAVAVALIVIANVLVGGMRSITFVQAFQYWLKLTAVAVPALVLGAYLLGAPGQRPGTHFAEPTTVTVAVDAAVHIAEPVTVHAEGAVDGADVHGPVHWPAGRHRIAAGTAVDFPAGAAVPAPQRGSGDTDSWARPGGGFGGPHPLFQVLSLMVGIFLGTMGLPHVLVRFYTNPDGRAARSTALSVIALLGAFYLFPTVLGAATRLLAPQLLLTGASDAAILLLPGAVVGGAGGAALAAILAAGAIAAFLSTSSGLLVSVAGVLATDVLPGRIRDFRWATVLAGGAALALAVGTAALDLSRVVGMVFAIAASTLCPLLVLGIWWRRLTAGGAIAGMVVGGLGSGAAMAVTAAGGVPAHWWGGWPAAVAGYPAAVTVPAAFVVTVAVSLWTRPPAPHAVARMFARMHLPEQLGGRADRERRIGRRR